MPASIPLSLRSFAVKVLFKCNGSFHDFTAQHYRGAATGTISSPPDDWGGGAILDWVTRLANRAGFDPEIERIVEVTEVLDQISRGE